jgi:hypothetical protein
MCLNKVFRKLIWKSSSVVYIKEEQSGEKTVTKYKCGSEL